MTIQEFIAENNITASTVRTDHNPLMGGNMDHWKVTLYRIEDNLDNSGAMRPKVARMTLTFSKGYGHKGAPPTAEEVLECLRNDAHTVEGCRDFDDFCAELGYDPDSRKAEKIYKACQRQTQKLQNFLGDTFDDFMNYEED